MPFELGPAPSPAGDQPRAIRELSAGLRRGDKYQTLLGVTGSGKTMTMAHVVADLGKPTLVLSHNKTLAAQLYGELKTFFPGNAVEFFISYYDYYQPEAYVPSTDTYIAKDSSINDDIERLRLRATSSLMERDDVIIVASVSAIYGLGDPELYKELLVTAQQGETRGRDALLADLVAVQYQRNDLGFERGTFRVRGDTVEVFPAYDEQAVRIEFWGDVIERIAKIDPLTGNVIKQMDKSAIYPATHFVTQRATIERAVGRIRAELADRLTALRAQNKLLGAMYEGDRSRKQTLVDYGFRLPSALDNRPLRFDEFMGLVPRMVFVSATPGQGELRLSGGVIVEQIIRPTGLVDPTVDIRPVAGQVDDLLSEIRLREKKNERVLVTTLTKRMAEDLTDYLQQHGVRVRYLHSEIDAIERVEIIRGLRLGEFDVLVGINLLREGLDLPEVSLVAILDADQEGFLRSDRSLIQTVGRAARHLHGRAILYADRVTGSMQRALDEMTRRRDTQLEYNAQHGITPRSIVKSVDQVRFATRFADAKTAKPAETAFHRPADAKERDALIKLLESQMQAAAEELDFELAAVLRDQILELRADGDAVRSPNAPVRGRAQPVR